MEANFKVGQLIIYFNGSNYEIGKIKTIKDNGAFIFYHSGETAALTSYADIKPIVNDYCITATRLGGE